MIRSLRFGAAALVLVLAGCLAGEAQEPKKDNPGEKKGFPKGGPGGPGGPGGRMGQPGQILPAFLAEMLKLTDDQKKELEALQKEVDAKLSKILTPEQLAQLKEMRGRGPGGPGGPGGGFGKGPEGKRPGPGDAPKKKDE